MLDRKTLAVGCVLACGCLVFFANHMNFAEEPKKEENISVANFRQENVIGFLGYPLGTVVRVKGVCFSGDELRMKASAGDTMLRVESVNGKPLERSANFRFHRAGNKISKPEAGDSFDYYVHEWGSFDGVVDPPKELNTSDPVVAHDGFYYRPGITIHKQNAPNVPEKKPSSESVQRTPGN